MGGGGYISSMNTTLKNNRALLRSKNKREERRGKYYKIKKKKPLQFHQLNEKERLVVIKNRERIEKAIRWRIITTIIVLIAFLAVLFLALY
ncbi:MAG: hypothetical protein ACPG4Z_05685 [Chitinophagales bacterium]